jgi:hypothetical protein
MTTTTNNQEHIDPQEAQRRAQEVIFLVKKLSIRVQPVFSAWLVAQSLGGIQECSQDSLARWLESLHPEQANAQQTLMVMEIAWLEYLSREFINLFVEKKP